MENASKALIIAGAILLAILLISLGILIFNQAQDTVNNSGMTQAQITAFNNKFLKYEGVQNASVIKSLINEVITVNADDSTPNITANRKVENTVTVINSTSVIDNSKKYNVELGYSNGVVNTITITQQ